MKEPLGGICGATLGVAVGVGVGVGCPLSFAHPITPIARDSITSDVNRIVSFLIYPPVSLFGNNLATESQGVTARYSTPIYAWLQEVPLDQQRAAPGVTLPIIFELYVKV